jgi:deoxyribodipyrimidine photolyase
VDPFLLDFAGPNRRRFLAQALRALDRELGGTLVMRFGDPHEVVPAVAAEVGASVVAATADFGPYGASRDHIVAGALTETGRFLLAEAVTSRASAHLDHATCPLRRRVAQGPLVPRGRSRDRP